MKKLVIFLLSIFCMNLANAAECREVFLAKLRDGYPKGYAIWNDLSEAHRKQLADLIKCRPDLSVAANDLDTLVHESVHRYDSELSLKAKNAEYLLVSGEVATLKSPIEAWSTGYGRGEALSAMSEEERRFGRAKTYLYDLGYEPYGLLLDELNAYAHGLDTDLSFPATTTGGTDSGDGPLEMVVYSLRYLEAMATRHPEYYRDKLIGDAAIRATTAKLVRQAYEVTNRSCERADLHVSYANIVRALETPTSRAQLAAIFGADVPTLESCPGIAGNGASLYATPVGIDYPKTAPTTPSGTASSATEEIEIPNPPYDPSKPFVTFYVTRIDATHLRADAEIDGVKLTTFIGLKPEDNYTLLNGKRLTEAEAEAYAKAHPDLVAKAQNARFIEVKATRTPNL